MPDSGRRRLVTSLGLSLGVGLPLVAAILPSSARAQLPGELMDPSRIGAPRKPSASPASASGASGQSGSAARRSQDQQPVYARDMAAAVVSSIDLLTRTTAELVENLLKMQAQERDLSAKLAELIAINAAKLDEYRNGLFCSGCNQTKSEILAKGQSFPHSGQSIVQPTAAQIDSKERELQAPIDRSERELRELRAKIAKTMAERDEALWQIGEGVKLWRTAMSFEHTLINNAEDDGIALYKTGWGKTGEQIRQLQGDLNLTKDKGKDRRAALLSEISMWQSLQQKLEAGRAEQRTIYQRAIHRASMQARDEQALLQSWVGRGKLGLVFALSVSLVRANTGSAYNELGGVYRMGNANPTRHDEVLPSVQRFIADFRAHPPR